MNKIRALLCAGFVILAALLSNPVAAQNQTVIPQVTVAGQLQRWTGMTLGGKNVGTVAIVDASGNQITSFGGSGGTSSTFAAAFPSTGTAIGMSQGGNMVALTGTSNNLNVQCANCSGSGVSTADAATFTASTSLFAGTGGFFQTTATNNALTNGQQGMWQMTANRAGFVNLRNVSGTELGVAAAPLQVSLANTAANATAVKTDGSAVTQPVSGTVTANLGTIAGVATAAKQPALGTAGSASTDVLTVQGIASMTPFLSNPGTAANWGLGTFGAAIGTVGHNIGLYDGTNLVRAKGDETLGAWVNMKAWGGTALGAPSAYGTSPGAVNVQGVNAFVTNTLSPGQAAAASSSPVVVAKNSGTGSTVAGAAVGTAGTASAEVVTVQGVASMTPLLANPGTAANWGVGATAAAVPASANYIGFNSGGNLTGPSTSTPLPVNQSDGTNTGLLDPCQSAAKSSLPITLATAAVKVIATGVSAKKIYVCAIDLTNNAADSVAVFEATTGTTCATSPIAVAGAGTSVATAATGYNFAANGGISKGNGGFQVMQTSVNNNDLCIAQSAATQLTGNITYVTR